MGSAPSQARNRVGSVTVIRQHDDRLSKPRSKSADNNTRQFSTTPLSEDVQLDVMISYSHVDTEIMNRLRDQLSKKGFIVWVDVVGLQAGVNFLDKIGKAIINARLFITLLSKSSISSKYCQDEISLAYVLDKPIYAVHIEDKEQLEGSMDIGMRLEFATLKWYDYSDEQTVVTTLDELAVDMEAAKQEAIKAENAMKNARNPAKPLKRQQTRSALRGGKSFNSLSDQDDFWEKSFSGRDSVSVQTFVEKLTPEVNVRLKHLIKTEVDKRWLVAIAKRKLGRKGIVDRSTYDGFCQDECGARMAFFDRLEEYAVERYVIKEVFQVDSSVRLEAIENLGRYRSAAVIDALTELLDDVDSDARAVAAITLAKTGIRNHPIISRLRKLLKDEDRLVRESACLALGHLKVEEAVPDLVDIWRTEVMSTVRDAAEMALKRVGGEAAEQALHMVGVLSKEIQFLINH